MAGFQLNSSNGDRKVVNEINVTPFVDVMLVLLIIFMVTAPMMQQHLDISLPKTRATELSTVPDNPFILAIKRNKDIVINSQSVSLLQVGVKASEMLKTRSDKMIYIQADQFVEYGVVANALAELKKAGLMEISLVTTFDQ